MQKLICTFVDGSQAVAYSTAKNFVAAVVDTLAILAPECAQSAQPLAASMRAAGLATIGEARPADAVTWQDLPRCYTNGTQGRQALELFSLRARLAASRGAVA